MASPAAATASPSRPATGREPSGSGGNRTDPSTPRVYGLSSGRKSRGSLPYRSSSGGAATPTLSSPPTKQALKPPISPDRKHQQRVTPKSPSSKRQSLQNRRNHSGSKPSSRLSSPKTQTKTKPTSPASPARSPTAPSQTHTQTAPQSPRTPPELTSSVARGTTQPQQSAKDATPLSAISLPMSPVPTPVSPPQQQQACLDASLMMLRTSMEDHSKPYEYLFQQSKTPPRHPAQISASSENGSGSKPWLSLVHQLHSKREQENTQLKRDLRRQKAKAKHYRSELRNNLSERLQFLEDRVRSNQQQERQQRQLALAATASGSVASSSAETSATTQSSTNGNDAASESTSLQQHNPAYEVVYSSGGASLTQNERTAADSNAHELQKKLEDTEQKYAKQKKEWSQRLDTLEGRYSADLEAWQKEVTQLKDEGRQLLAERNQLSAQLNVINNNSALSAGITIQSKLQQTEQERDDALKLLDELQEEYESQKDELDEARNKAKDAKQTARSVQKLYKAELKALDEPIAAVESEYKEAVRKCNELQTRMKQVELQHADDKATWKLQLECALANARKEASEREGMEKELKQEIKESKDALASLQKQHQADTDEWNSYAAEKARVTAAAEEQEQAHQLQVSALHEDIARATAAAEEREQAHQTQLSELHQEIATLTKEKDVALAGATVASNQLVSIQTKHTSEVQELQEQLQELDAALTEQRDALQTQLTQSLESHATEVQQMQTSHAQEISELRTELKATKESLTCARLLNATNAKDIDEWKETAAKLEENVKDVMEAEAASAESYEAQLDELRSRLGQLSSENSNLQVDVELVEKAERRLRALQDENEQLRESKQKLSLEVTKTKQDCDENLAVAKSLHTNTADELERKQKDQEEMWSVKYNASQAQIKELETKFQQADLLMVEKEDSWAAKLESNKAQIRDLGRQLAEADSRAKNNMQREEQAKADREKEMGELRRKLADCEREYIDLKDCHNGELERLKQLHLDEVQELSDRLHNASSKSQILSDQSKVLSASLEEVNALHENKTSHWEAEILRLEQENDNLKALLAAKQNEDEAAVIVQETIAAGFEKYQQEISCAVVELRGDIATVREAVQKNLEKQHQTESIESAQDADNIKNSVNGVHTSIYDALAEITLETENLIECRSGIQTLVERTNRLLDRDHQNSNNDKLLQDQMTSLEGLLTKVLDRDLETTQNTQPLASCMAELTVAKEQLLRERSDKEGAEKRLRRKEELLKSETTQREKAEERIRKLEDQSEQLAFERKMRLKAEKEIVTLNDQADAYGEEVMRLQGLNTELEDTLKEAERRMEAALTPTETAEVVAVHSENHDSPEKPSDFSSPMLDEALALAQNLTALMKGQEDTERETSVMEMLETISDMIDQTGGTDSSALVNTSIDIPVEVEIATPQRKELDLDNEDPPLPILSPPHPILTQSPTKERPSGELTVVVEQLYGRCQLLERERTEIMEVALDILQSAREASSAELEAALATARRKSAEELLKVRKENQSSMFRLYHKLCGTCQHGLTQAEATQNPGDGLCDQASEEKQE